MYDPERIHEDEYDILAEGRIQCASCGQWWDEGAEGAPHTSDDCVDNTRPYCDECRHEMNNDRW